MKCCVIYYSQTGNTEKMARAIQKGIKETAGHCDLFEIKDANPKRLYEYDLIGLGSNVIAWAEPGNVRAFINDMKFVGGKHVFYFATHGTKPYLLVSSVYQRLSRKGMIITGIRGWFCNCTLLFMPDPYPTAGHPDETDLKEAEQFGREMVDRSRRISAGETGLVFPPPPEPEEMPGGYGFDEIDKKFERMFHFYKEKCTYPECRLCMDICPMYGIDLSVDPPVLIKPCIKCMSCALICPTGAIDIDEWIKETAEKMKEIYPQALEPALNLAEAEGRFRRLLPKEKIGRDTPLYTSLKKHPYWVTGKGLQR
jgi:flavodoxin/NAD-dependent dihydropyrimidine dehydrogenase PreA subunit